MKEIQLPTKEQKSQYDLSHYLELIIRIIVGLFLILNGVYFLNNNAPLEELLGRGMSVLVSELIIIFIGTVHLFGGVLIVIGLFTRLAIVLQIPAVLLESYFIKPPASFIGNSDMYVSILILIPLFFLFVRNSGAFSLDYYKIKKHQLKTNEKARMINDDK